MKKEEVKPDGSGILLLSQRSGDRGGQISESETSLIYNQVPEQPEYAVKPCFRKNKS